MEEWRKVYFKKLETKAFRKADFGPTFHAVLEDEEETHKTIDKTIVANQLLWHWDRLNAGYSDALARDINNQDKHNFKSVTNNLIRKYFKKDDFKEWYLSLGTNIVEDDIVQLK